MIVISNKFRIFSSHDNLWINYVREQSYRMNRYLACYMVQAPYTIAIVVLRGPQLTHSIQNQESVILILCKDPFIYKQASLIPIGHYGSFRRCQRSSIPQLYEMNRRWHFYKCRNHGMKIYSFSANEVSSQYQRSIVPLTTASMEGQA